MVPTAIENIRLKIFETVSAQQETRWERDDCVSDDSSMDSTTVNPIALRIGILRSSARANIFLATDVMCAFNPALTASLLASGKFAGD